MHIKFSNYVIYTVLVTPLLESISQISIASVRILFGDMGSIH